jgi:hypothetical protein
MFTKNDVSIQIRNFVHELSINHSWDRLKKISSATANSSNCAGYSTVYELNEQLVVKVFNKEAYQKDIDAGEEAAYDYEVLK